MPIKLPAGVKRPLLLIIPDKKAPTGLRTIVFEDDSGSFRWGTMRMLNLTPKSLVVRWEKTAKALPPGWKATDISPGGDSRNIEVRVYLKDDLKKPLYSAVWEHREDMRQLVFVVPNPDPALGPVDFKFVPENRADVENKAPQP